MYGSLYKNCKQEKLNYGSITYRIRNLIKNGFSMDEAIKKSVERQRELEQRKKCGIYLDKCLKENVVNKDAKKICKLLDVNYSCVKRFSYLNYSSGKVIFIIYFFGDYSNNIKGKRIRKKSLDNVLANNIEKNLYNLLISYKMGYDVFEELLIHEIVYINRIISKLAFKYNFKLDLEKKTDLIQEAYFHLLKAIKKISINNIASISSYLGKTISFRLRDFMLQNYHRHISYEPYHIEKEKDYEYSY